MPEPTEGPWSAPPSGAYGQWPVLGPNYETIAFATAQPGDRWKAAANARRMAAAPDLYDFAEKFVVWAEDMPDENYEQVEIDLIAIAKAALTKAKGK